MLICRAENEEMSRGQRRNHTVKRREPTRLPDILLEFGFYEIHISVLLSKYL